MTWTALHDACVHGLNDRVAKLAHEHSDQANKVDDHGLTPLHMLILANPSLEAVKALLEAYPMAASEPDFHGDTPLHLAVSCPTATKELVQLLLDANPTGPSQTNREGLMPLHAAARYASQNEKVIGLLIQTYPQALLSHIKVRPTVVLFYFSFVWRVLSHQLLLCSRWVILPRKRETKSSWTMTF